MAQVSYGTITITDTNDIERIYTVYAKSANNTTVPTAAAANWKESISEAPGTGNYIWQRTVVQKSGTQEKTYSDPVCLTGEEGTDGRGITSITIKYGTSADWNTQPSNWYDNTPEYSSSTPNYWTQTTISYTTGNPTVKVTQDKALTQAIYDSIVANSLAQSANENANGAMGQAASNVNEVKRIWYAQAATTPVPAAPTTGITTSATHDAWSITKPAANESYQYYFYCDQTKTGGGVYSWSEVILDTSTLSQYQIGALNAKVKNFWWDSSGAHVASGKNGNEVNKDTISTYGYHALMGLTGISFNYDGAKVVDLNSTTPSLDFYQPPTISGNTVAQGKKTMMLSANALRFYNPTDGTTEQAVLDTNGLVLKKGGIVAGTKGQTGYIYLSTVNHPVGTNGVTINGFTPTSSTEQWREVVGTKFGVTNAGTLYANNAVISGTITVGSGSTIDSGATIGGTSASTVVSNAATGAQASNDLSNFQTTVANTYATQSALSDVEGQIPSDINELSDTDGIIPNDLSQLTDTTNIISGAVNTGVAGKADKTEAVYRTQRIYYRKTTTGAPSKNTTWLATSGTGYGNWSTKIPQLTNGTDKYPYLYTAIQSQTITQYNGGTGTSCSCSDVLLDDSTTIIDGGSIIAGSVTANEITGSKLSAIYADMGNITAGNITKGYNSINFDNSPATLEFKNNSTWANATKGIQWTGSDLNIKGNITATSLTISSGATVSGVVVPSQIANMATQADVAGASYSVEIQVTSINYANNSATLVAIPYYQGSTTIPDGVTLSYQWYKNGSALADTSTAPTITGATTNTLQLGEGTDFGSSTTNAIYTCVIS